MKHMIVMWILTLLVSSVRAEIFRDDFNDGDLTGWTFVQGAENGGIQNSELVLSSLKVDSEAEVIIVVDGIVARDYEVTVSVKISRLASDISGGASIGLRAHTDPLLESIIENAPAQGDGDKIPLSLLYGRSYKFILGYQDIDHQGLKKGFEATIQHVKVSTRRNALTVISRTKSHAFRLFDFKLHEWYRLKIIVKGNRFQCFIDDKEILNFLDDTYTEGRISLSSGLGNRVHFDDFEVQYEALAVQPRRKLTTPWGEIKRDFH